MNKAIDPDSLFLMKHFPLNILLLEILLLDKLQ